jgi:hypothetical protein
MDQMTTFNRSLDSEKKNLPYLIEDNTKKIYFTAVL